MCVCVFVEEWRKRRNHQRGKENQGGEGGGERFNQRSQEEPPTRCREGPARFSCPQVDLNPASLCACLVARRLVVEVGDGRQC